MSSSLQTAQSIAKLPHRSDIYEFSTVDVVSIAAPPNLVGSEVVQSRNEQDKYMTGYRSPALSYTSNSMHIDPSILSYPGLFPPPAVASEVDSFAPMPFVPQIASPPTSARQSIFGLEKTMNEPLQPIGSLEKRKPTRSKPALENYKSRSNAPRTPLRGGIPVATIMLPGVGSAGSKTPKGSSTSEDATTSRALGDRK